MDDDSMTCDYAQCPGRPGRVVLRHEACIGTEIAHRQPPALTLPQDAGAHEHLIALARVLPAEVRDQLRAAHDADPDGICCNAHGEGLRCCVDILLQDPSRYDPEKVAAAEKLLRRYREQPR